MMGWERGGAQDIPVQCIHEGGNVGGGGGIKIQRRKIKCDEI